MRIHNTELQYEIENHSDLVQDRKCNICKVPIMVANRMQGMRNKLLGICISYIQSHIF